MSKDLLGKYYQENQERLQKRAREKYQSLSNKEKQNKRQYGCERFKISLKMKNKGCLSIEK